MEDLTRVDPDAQDSEQTLSSFVCVIGRTNAHNWDLCKEVAAYGIPGTGGMAAPRAEVGDDLFVWIGGRGFVAEATISSEVRPPKSKKEAPWGGGTYRYSYIVPFTLVLEVKQAVTFAFDGQRQTATGISKIQPAEKFLPYRVGRS